jgi:hypothetical protein
MEFGFQNLEDFEYGSGSLESLGDAIMVLISVQLFESYLAHFLLEFPF